MLYVSCQKELEINYPDIEPKLVVNCLFTPDSTFSVRVGQMLSLNDTVTSFIINDAQCKIWENGIFAEDLLVDAALPKLMVAVANSKSLKHIKELMQTNFADEITKRELAGCFNLKVGILELLR